MGERSWYPEARPCQPNSQVSSNCVLHSLLSPSPPPTPLGPQKLLGKLCEQNKVVREQDRLVQQLRAEKVRATGQPWTGTHWARHGEGVGCYLHPKPTKLCRPETSVLPFSGTAEVLSTFAGVRTASPSFLGDQQGSGLCCWKSQKGRRGSSWPFSCCSSGEPGKCLDGDPPGTGDVWQPACLPREAAAQEGVTAEPAHQHSGGAVAGDHGSPKAQREPVFPKTACSFTSFPKIACSETLPAPMAHPCPGGQATRSPQPFMHWTPRGTGMQLLNTGALPSALCCRLPSSEDTHISPPVGP